MLKTTSVPLAKLDPLEAWKPWQPDEQEPWNLKLAGHLYRRAGFSARWDELQQALKEGPEPAIKRFLSGGPNQETFDADVAFSMKLGTSDARMSTVQEYQGVWLYRMLRSPHPLQERMTLFWHNHFATSVAKVRRPDLMQQQNTLLRKHSLGKFGTLLREISHDPAMLKWLDSNNNVKGKANENYARELFELFSLGVGNYTEKDIQEAARAFTGWHTDGEQFLFNKAQHDHGSKTVLGKTGTWDGEDVVRIALEQPACARFLVGKLYRTFISENEPPPDRLIEALAEQLRKSDYDIGGVVATMLRSRLFFSDHAYRQRIKSPVEYLVGMLRSLEGNVPRTNSLAQTMDGLAQMLYMPPTVKGWDGGKAWLNSATILARHNLAWSIVGGEDNRFRGHIDPAALVQKHAGAEPEKQIDFLLNLLLDGTAPSGAQQKLLAFLTEGSPKDTQLSSRLRETTHHVILLPEYQLA